MTFAVFAHCFTCTKNIKAAVNISRALAERGVGVLRVELEGDLDEEQRARLMAIADACPVHRTLEAGVHVTTKGD